MRVFIRYCGYELYTYVQRSDIVKQAVYDAIFTRVKYGRTKIGEIKYNSIPVQNYDTFTSLGVQEDDIIYVSSYKVSVGIGGGHNIKLYNSNRVQRGSRKDYYYDDYVEDYF